jgi:sporulation protein YlmC with PRC-barrel domain
MSDLADRERHVELLLGRRVYGRRGRAVGHIEELHAEREGDYHVIAAIDIGPVALLERLAVRHLGFAWRGRLNGYRVRWDQIDLEDERRPTLTCGMEDLEVIGPPRARRGRR